MTKTPRPTIITETHVDVFGAERLAEIVDRRLDGRLLVANPGKANAWLVLDRAAPPAALMKALKGLAVASDVRIVVRRKERPEAVEEAIAKVVAFMTDGSVEKAAKREAAAAARSAAKAAGKAAAAEAERLAAARARQAARDAERRRIEEETRPARQAAAAERAAARLAEAARLHTARVQRTCYRVAERPEVGESFVTESRSRNVRVVAESYGRSWTDGYGDEVCYVYWRFATTEDVDAPRYEVRVGTSHIRTETLPVEKAPEVGDRLALRDGTRGVVTCVHNRRYLDSGDEDDSVTSFYSSELWDRTVIDVDFIPDGSAA